MTDISTQVPADGKKLVEAEVIASGVSYFTSNKVLDAVGEPQKDQQGNPLSVINRHDALMGDKISVSQFEYDRLAALGAVQEPGSSPLPRDRDPVATVFSVPLPDKIGFQGPAMGDPSPVGQLPDNELNRRNELLTEEQRLELERKAAEEGGTTDPEDATDAVLLWEEDTSADDVKAFVDANDLNAAQTVALADSKDHAEVVLSAELARDQPRKSVVEPLEKSIEEEPTA